MATEGHFLLEPSTHLDQLQGPIFEMENYYDEIHLHSLIIRRVKYSSRKFCENLSVIYRFIFEQR